MKRRRRQAGGVWQVLSTAVFVAVIVLIVLRSTRQTPASLPAPAAEMPRPHVETIDAAAAPPGVAASPHVALGVPTDLDPSDDVLLDEEAFVLSYNPNRHDPNWVAWQLDASHLGHARRKNNFRPDQLLPAAYYHVTPGDYLRGGYDRGHLCPSADRSGTAEQNALTFLMTNMLPQLHELNAGPWEKLEEHERELAKLPQTELYIAAGGIFDPDPPTIGHGVAVPKASYKIIAVLRQGETAADVTRETTVLAVIMPNVAGVGQHEWTDFVVSVDDVERESGYDFFNRVPQTVQAAIESRRALLP